MVLMGETTEFKWIWEVPDLRDVKQPDTVTPDEFMSLIQRIDNERVDPLIARRNQAMLWMTYGSLFRAVEVAKWTVKAALYPNGDLVRVTRLRAEQTKGNHPALAPIVIAEQRQIVSDWLDMRVKHRIGLDKQGRDKYRGLDPDSPVFMSFHHGVWKPFSLTRKVTKGKEYFVATVVQNLLTKLYKDYGHTKCSSHTGRHSMARFAEKMYKRRNDPDAQRIVQQLLHHRDPDSQRDYTDIDFQHIRACAARMMPEPKKRGRPVRNG